MGKPWGRGASRALLAGALGAILGAAPAAAAQQPPQLVATVGNNLFHGPTFVGVERGIYLKHGIDLKLKVISTGPESAKALQAGEAQFAPQSISPWIVSVERGWPGVAVVIGHGSGTVTNFDEPIALVARREAGIRAVADLAGKKLGFAPGSASDFWARVLLKHHQVPADRVTILNTRILDALPALRSGSVDAIATWEPYVTMLLEKVPGAALVARGGGLIGQINIIAAHKDLIRQDPDLVFRFVLAQSEAAQYARQRPGETAEVATRWVPGLEVGIATRAISHMAYDTRITRHTLQAYDETVKDLLDQKKLRGPVPRETAFDGRFIDRVVREHPQFFADLAPPR
jgi:ABC-type nitrate/sulfonate/bicarbonate transport system substrate-binding protein